MLIPLSWLNEYLKRPLAVHAATLALEQAGIEVESIRETGSFDPAIITVKLTKVAKHPHADRLSLATIQTGKADIQIVTGASNLALGQVLAYAQPGTSLPNGQLIQTANIRGVSSAGMLLSAAELGIGADQTGLIELDPATPVGKPLNQVFKSDWVIDIKTAANRPDLHGMVWLAREVAAQTDNQVKVTTDVPVLADKSPAHFQNQAKELVKRFALARLQLPARLPDTPDWMRQRLELAGSHSINLIVDITNYIMIEYGQPLHAFDADKIKGKIGPRLAKTGEKLTMLDGKTLSLTGSDLVIADEKGPVGLAGVMGGKHSEVDGQTRTVILEAANFDGVSIRQTALAHGLRTDASARFERGLPLQFVALAMNRALGLMEELARAKTEWIEDELNAWPWVQHVGVRPAKLARLADLKVSEPEVIDHLSKLGFSAEKFDIVTEAKKHLGKPYVWGASFKTHGAGAFDCGYLIDYIFSLIGVQVGHTAPQQYGFGRSVGLDELQPGDILFRDGEWVKLDRKARNGISHDVIYIGNGKILHAKDYDRDGRGKWKKLPAGEGKVVIEPIAKITHDPDYIGARRLIEDLDGWVAVTVPYWRPDVKLEEDVFEEVIKLVGFEAIGQRLPAWRFSEFKYDPSWSRLSDVRAALIGMGLFEAVTYPFVSESQIKTLGLDHTRHLELANPRSVEQKYLRTTLSAGLLQAVINNQFYKNEFGFFEEGRIYLPADELLPQERHNLAVIIYGPSAYRQVKNVFDQLMLRFKYQPELKGTPDLPFLHSSRQLQINLGQNRLGIMGEFNPLLLVNAKLRQPVGYLEIDLAQLLKATEDINFQTIGKYQAIRRDLTVLLSTNVSWQEVQSSVQTPSNIGVSYGGEYTGREFKGRRALTLHIQIEPVSEQLSDKEIDQIVGSVYAQLSRQFGAVLH